MQRRKFAGLMATVVVPILALAAPPGAQTPTAPVAGPVAVGPGPASSRTVELPCNDVVLLGFQERLSFVLRRTGSAAAPLAVTYRLSGTAVPGVHYERLPGYALFAPGVSTVVVPVTPRPTRLGSIVSLALEVVPGGSTATISFVSPPGPGPYECGYRFTADGWNTWQTIPVGGTPHALTLEQDVAPAVLPAQGRFRVVDGRLPDGVSLARDGTFTGRATSPGFSMARVEACRPQPPGTCVTTTLVVVVSSGPAPPPPTPGPAPTPCLPWVPVPWQPPC